MARAVRHAISGRGTTVTTLKFDAAATRTDVVATHATKALLVVGAHDRRDVGHGSAGSQQLGHDLHLAINVMKERVIALTQIVETFVTFLRAHETIPRTLPVAGESHIAPQALWWQTEIQKKDSACEKACR